MGPRRCRWLGRELPHVGLIHRQRIPKGPPHIIFIRLKKPRARNAERQFGHGSILGGRYHPRPQRSKAHEIIQFPLEYLEYLELLEILELLENLELLEKKTESQAPKSPHATNPKPTPPECRKITPMSQQKKVKKEKNDPPLINPLYLCIVKRTVIDNIFSW